MLKNNPYRVLGVGAACIDLLLPVSEEFLSQQVPGAKGGSQPIDSEQFNLIVSKSGVTPTLATGGSCANTIKGLASLGEKCAFLSHVGSDPLGKHFAHYMEKLGVVNLFYRSKEPTARVLCLITPDGQRTMRYCMGSSEEIPLHFLNLDYFKGVTLVHIDAYSFRNGNLVKQVMQLAKKAGAKISIDLSSFEIVQDYHHTLMELLPQFVDIVFANRDETKALLGLDPFEGCLKLHTMCPIAIVLLGPAGCFVSYQGRLLHSPAYPAQLVDSTGAGDLFACGFLYDYLHGYSIAQCARLGNRLGGAIIEYRGAELPLEKWKEVQAFWLEDSPL